METTVIDTIADAVAAFDWFGLVLVPLLIVAARVVDVSLGTLRVVFIGRGLAVPASLVGFFESLVWLLAASQILGNLTSPYYYVAYAAGFGLGNYVGLKIEHRLALGKVILRVISARPPDELIDAVRDHDVGITVLDGEGATGSVHVVLSVLHRRDLGTVLDELNAVWPQAFYTVEPAATVAQGVFPQGRGVAMPWSRRQRK